MKIALINTSDTLGGAAIVTHRLMEALRNAGHDARMVTFVKYGDSPYVIEAATRSQRGNTFVPERGWIFLHNGLSRANLFKVSIANTGLPLHKHPWIKEADIISLNWINQGTLSIKGIERLCALGKPVVWTMHDMWCMTGACHHAYECTGYRERCGHCQFFHGGSSENDLSRSTWLRKKALYDKTDIHFVAVSNWLADKCRQSSLLGGKSVTVIPNAYPVTSYHTEPYVKMHSFDIDYKRDLIVMGAARLDDPIKGLHYAIKAFNYVFDNNPEWANRCTVIFFGNIRDAKILNEMQLPFIYIGQINDPKILHELYARAKVVVSSSLYETLPTTLIEGQAAGATPVSFGGGGQTDIIRHGVSGYIAEYRNSDSLGQHILKALEKPFDRQFLHDEVTRHFGAEAIAARYIELFNTLLAAKGTAK